MQRQAEGGQVFWEEVGQTTSVGQILEGSSTHAFNGLGGSDSGESEDGEDGEELGKEEELGTLEEAVARQRCDTPS
ncbi:hypothetical protein PM082_022592 [Marasmius tenuissimus]|nr:hypothetical protein PM082_022592 [Marasmius tenuissimus]